MKKEQYKISIIRPEGVTKSEMKAYIADAVKNLCRSLKSKTKNKKPRKMACPDCGEKEMCYFEPDPYEAEVYNDNTPVWSCEKCRENSASFI